MANEHDKPNVFVCYHKDDRQQVEPIVNSLRSQEPAVKAWYAPEVLSDNWMAEATKALSVVACMLVFCGKRTGNWQPKEVVALIEANRPVCVIPVLLPGVPEIPSEFRLALADRSPLGFSDHPSEAQEQLRKRVHQAIAPQIPAAQHSHACGIQIDVSRVPRTCVVAAVQPTPGRRSLSQRAREAIEKLKTAGQGSLPETVTELRTCGTDECIQSIRESELLIADFPLGPGSRGPSLKAAYWLGMANALGKSTILISDDPSLSGLVSNTRSKMSPSVHVIVPGDLNKMLGDLILEVCRATEPSFLVEQHVQGIGIVETRFKVRAQLGPTFLHLLRFGVDTLQYCRLLIEEAHSLFTHVQEMSDRADRDRGAIDSNELKDRRDTTWNKFQRFDRLHKDWDMVYRSSLDNEKVKIREDFNCIKQRLDEEPQAKDLNTATLAWEKILEDVDAYLLSYNKLCRYAEGEVPADSKSGEKVHFACLNKYPTAAELQQEMEWAHKWLSKIPKHCHEMVENLLKLTFELEDHSS